MEAKLVVVGGKANKSEVKLKLPAMIGRGRDADVTVAHSTVSRHHCLIYELDGALVVRDNGSLNGTVVDGERIKESLLKPGQSLTIGPLTFRADYQHDGDFPVLGAAPSGVAESNGEAATGGAHAASQPSKAKTHEEEEEETVQAEAAAVEAALPDVPALPEMTADEEPANNEPVNGEFDFLSEDEPAETGSSSEPSFSFLKDSNTSDDDHDDDSAEVFRIADEPPAAPQAVDKPPSRTKPADKSPALTKPADKNTAPASKGTAAAAKGAAAASKGTAAPAKGDDDAALNDFLNSLGLEE